jgi:hypothetical protein
MVIHKGGTTYDWEILAYGAPGLPVAGGAGEVPLSTGAGTTYVAANFGDEVGAAIADGIGSTLGQALIGDGAGDIIQTSADVSAVLAAADAAAARAALGVAGAPTSGTLAARPASPAAGDAYAVTSGDASGDRYQCFVAGSWSLVSYDRLVGVGAPYLQWLLDEAAGTYAQTGSATGGTLTVTGAVAREAPGLLGENAARFTSDNGQYAEGGASLTPPSGAFSVSVWVKPDLIGSVASLFVKPFASSGWLTPFASVYLYLQISGRVRCGVTIAGSPVDLSPASGPVAVVAQWSQVAMVWDGAGSPKLSLYLDGELVGSSSPAGTDVDWNTDGAWSVSNSRAADGIRGTVGGARVWGVALTAAQVREDFRRGAGIYRGQ